MTFSLLLLFHQSFQERLFRIGRHRTLCRRFCCCFVCFTRCCRRCNGWSAKLKQVQPFIDFHVLYQRTAVPARRDKNTSTVNRLCRVFEFKMCGVQTMKKIPMQNVGRSRPCTAVVGVGGCLGSHVDQRGTVRQTHLSQFLLKVIRNVYRYLSWSNTARQQDSKTARQQDSSTGKKNTANQYTILCSIRKDLPITKLLNRKKKQTYVGGVAFTDHI